MLVSELKVTKGNGIVHVLDDPHYNDRGLYDHILVGDYIAYQYNTLHVNYLVRQRTIDRDWLYIDSYESIDAIIKEL